MKYDEIARYWTTTDPRSFIGWFIDEVHEGSQPPYVFVNIHRTRLDGTHVRRLVYCNAGIVPYRIFTFYRKGS